MCFHQGGSRGTRTHKRVSLAPAFEAGSSSGRMTSTLSSCGGRNRTCMRPLTGACLYQPGPTASSSVRTVGFEPTISCVPRHADSQTFPHRCRVHITPLRADAERPAGVEPALPPWQGSRLPLHHGRMNRLTEIVKDQSKSTGWDSNPRRRITSAVSSPLDDQCLLSVGPLGLEPRPARLRAGDAAANTSIPCCCSLFTRSARTESNRRLALIRSRLSPLSYGPVARASVRPEGFEPPPCELKARCAAVTPRPRDWSRYAFQSLQSVASQHSHRALLSRVAREGVEPSFPPYQSGVLNRWTTGLGVVAVGMAGLEPTIPCSQGTWGAAPLHPVLCQ